MYRNRLLTKYIYFKEAKAFHKEFTINFEYFKFSEIYITSHIFKSARSTTTQRFPAARTIVERTIETVV